MRIACGVMGLLLLGGATRGGGVPDGPARPLAVDSLAGEYFGAWVARNPESATFQGLPGAEDAQLSDNSPAALLRWQAKEDAWRRRIDAIPVTALQGTDDEVTLAYMRDALDRSIGSRNCRRELWGLNHLSGWQTDLPLLAGVQPVGSAAARRAALARLRAMPRYLAQERENLREGLRLGYAAPPAVAGRVRGQVLALISADGRESPLFAPATRDSTPGFGAELQRVIETDINPAMQAFADFLQDEYLPSARSAAGIHALPDGKACYRALVREWTTLDADPDSLFAVGEAVLQELTATRDSIAHAMGFSSAREALDAARAAPENHFQSRQDIVNYAQGLVDRVEGKMGAMFERLPSARVEVRAFPEYQERSAPGGQYLPAPSDGSRPANYLINTSSPERRNRIGLETLTWHEALPGHHLQLALAAERPAAHPITRYLINSGFAEGWALYAELLADEMGLFSSPAQRLAMYNSLRFRAARLVVDPGIHVKGWSREQALAFMGTTLDADPQAFAVEVDRYMAMPGQATSYLTGMLAIRRLRHDAEAALGSEMDLRAFHSRVLENGAVPLALLDTVVRRWLVAERPTQ